MKEKLIGVLRYVKSSKGQITVLTGAGISAESGIPTFRGHEGYWTVGSREYHPQEMATLQMFRIFPYEVWQWYLYRRSICAKAEPNAAHLSLAELERVFQKRFCLITQNVDGLHLRAGNTSERTYQIHGNLNFMRCSRECTDEIVPLPADIPPHEKGSEISEDDKNLLRCPHCGAICRPHVLWFDECYDEHYYHFDGSIRKARETDLLLVIGTSGATNLPLQIGALVLQHNGAVIDINPDENPFAEMARRVERGFHLPGRSAEILPQIIECLVTT